MADIVEENPSKKVDLNSQDTNKSKSHKDKTKIHWIYTYEELKKYFIIFLFMFALFSSYMLFFNKILEVGLNPILLLLILLGYVISIIWFYVLWFKRKSKREESINLVDILVVSLVSSLLYSVNNLSAVSQIANTTIVVFGILGTISPLVAIEILRHDSSKSKKITGNIFVVSIFAFLGIFILILETGIVFVMFAIMLELTAIILFMVSLLDIAHIEEII